MVTWPDHGLGLVPVASGAPRMMSAYPSPLMSATARDWLKPFPVHTGDVVSPANACPLEPATRRRREVARTAAGPMRMGHPQCWKTDDPSILSIAGDGNLQLRAPHE